VSDDHKLRHTTTTKTEKASEKRTNSNYQETEGKENKKTYIDHISIESWKLLIRNIYTTCIYKKNYSNTFFVFFFFDFRFGGSILSLY
jgi:hypothetical protein